VDSVTVFGIRLIKCR